MFLQPVGYWLWVDISSTPLGIYALSPKSRLFDSSYYPYVTIACGFLQMPRQKFTLTINDKNVILELKMGRLKTVRQEERF